MSSRSRQEPDSGYRRSATGDLARVCWKWHRERFEHYIEWGMDREPLSRSLSFKAFVELGMALRAAGAEAALRPDARLLAGWLDAARELEPGYVARDPDAHPEAVLPILVFMKELGALAADLEEEWLRLFGVRFDRIAPRSPTDGLGVSWGCGLLGWNVPAGTVVGAIPADSLVPDEGDVCMGFDSVYELTHYILYTCDFGLCEPPHEWRAEDRAWGMLIGTLVLRALAADRVDLTLELVLAGSILDCLDSFLRDTVLDLAECRIRESGSICEPGSRHAARYRARGDRAHRWAVSYHPMLLVAMVSTRLSGQQDRIDGSGGSPDERIRRVGEIGRALNALRIGDPTSAEERLKAARGTVPPSGLGRYLRCIEQQLARNRNIRVRSGCGRRKE